jgi:hypothetical protein
VYSQQLQRSVLQSRTPLQVMKDWYKIKPELFKKKTLLTHGMCQLPDALSRIKDHKINRIDMLLPWNYKK